MKNVFLNQEIMRRIKFEGENFCGGIFKEANFLCVRVKEYCKDKVLAFGIEIHFQ